MQQPQREQAGLSRLPPEIQVDEGEPERLQVIDAMQFFRCSDPGYDMVFVAGSDARATVTVSSAAMWSSTMMIFMHQPGERNSRSASP